MTLDRQEALKALHTTLVRVYTVRKAQRAFEKLVLFGARYGTVRNSELFMVSSTGRIRQEPKLPSRPWTISNMHNLELSTLEIRTCNHFSTCFIADEYHLPKVAVKARSSRRTKASKRQRNKFTGIEKQVQVVNSNTRTKSKRRK